MEAQEAGAEDCGQLGCGGIIGDCSALDDIKANVGRKPIEMHMRGEKERERAREAGGNESGQLGDLAVGKSIRSVLSGGKGSQEDIASHLSWTSQCELYRHQGQSYGRRRIRQSQLGRVLGRRQDIGFPSLDNHK